ncbi:hypothetical protein L7F22_033939 [Adiantum nelumboides]|nr:hypothetical protein [Adiantum nelumboides]
MLHMSLDQEEVQVYVVDSSPLLEESEGSSAENREALFFNIEVCKPKIEAGHGQWLCASQLMDPLIEQRSTLKAQAEAAALILFNGKKLHYELHEGPGLGKGQGLGPSPRKSQGLGPKLKQMPNEARPARATARKGKIRPDREQDVCPAAEAAENAPNEPCSVLQETQKGPEDPNFLCVELRKIVQQLTTSLHAEAQNSFALRGLLDDIRNAYATSQASFAVSAPSTFSCRSWKMILLNLDHTIEQLRGEVLHLNQAASLQKNKEVDLDVAIQHLKEEVIHLKVMQEIERERKAAEYLEIQHLREEMVKLNEGSTKKLQMVEEMSDTIQQLLKHGQSLVPTNSCQLSHNSAENSLLHSSMDDMEGALLVCFEQPSSASDTLVQIWSTMIHSAVSGILQLAPLGGRGASQIFS